MVLHLDPSKRMQPRYGVDPGFLVEPRSHVVFSATDGCDVQLNVRTTLRERPKLSSTESLRGCRRNVVAEAFVPVDPSCSLNISWDQEGPGPAPVYLEDLNLAQKRPSGSTPHLCFKSQEPLYECAETKGLVSRVSLRLRISDQIPDPALNESECGRSDEVEQQSSGPLRIAGPCCRQQFNCPALK